MILWRDFVPQWIWRLMSWLEKLLPGVVGRQDEPKAVVRVVEKMPSLHQRSLSAGAGKHLEVCVPNASITSGLDARRRLNVFLSMRKIRSNWRMTWRR